MLFTIRRENLGPFQKIPFSHHCENCNQELGEHLKDYFLCPDYIFSLNDKYIGRWSTVNIPKQILTEDHIKARFCFKPKKEI